MAVQDFELQLLLGSMDQFQTSLANATQIAATDNLNKRNRQWQSAEAEKNRQFNSAEAQLARDFSAKQAELAYDRQLEFYDTRMSVGARMQQIQDAGLNPALAYGSALGSAGQSSAPMASSSPSASAGSAPSASSGGISPLQVFSMLESVLAIKRQQADIEKTQAETHNIVKETSWIDAYNSTNIQSMKAGIDKVRSDIKVNESVVNSNIQSVAESMKRVDVMDSQIELNGALVDLHGSQQVLNDCRAATEKLNAATIQKMLPYIEARQQAEIALTNANSNEAKFSAESKMYDANLKFLQGMVDAKLIDSGYYDSIIESKNYDVRMKKRDYKWKPVNDICHNMSMIMIGTGSILSGVGGAASGLGQAAVVSQTLSPRNPIGYNR